jgi:hypothetical protein
MRSAPAARTLPPLPGITPTLARCRQVDWAAAHAWIGSVVECSGDGIKPVCGLLTCLDGPADVPLDALETG